MRRRPYGDSHPHRPHRGPQGQSRPHGGHRIPQSVNRPAPTGPRAPVTGLYESTTRGGGVLRPLDRNYATSPPGPVIHPDLAGRLGLRGGEVVEAVAAGGAVVEATRIDGLSPTDAAARPAFGDLTVVDPCEAIHFETPGGPITTRVIDLMTPIGKGQRALIVAPPRTGKTVLLKQMANAIKTNHPEILLMMLLVDERPEEVTEMRRSVCDAGSGWHNGKPEVVFSNNDQDAPSHLRISRLMIEKAKRSVESGKDVLILLDSLTRLSRAFNTSIGSSGRTMTGGLDINALAEPKSIFGAARKIEHGGSLTIIASVLIETGSRMDDFIFQEFKGTGNMELVLTRELANLRIWPAVDLAQSGTRKEELLLPAGVLQKVYRLRRRLMSMPPVAQVETLIRELEQFKSNADAIAAMAG